MNPPIDSQALRDFIIASIIVGIVALLVYGCAQQQPAPVPVVVQAAPAPTPAPIPDPYASLSPDVAAAIKHGDTPTLQHGITTLFPYSPDLQYPLNCQPLHVVQIRLESDEQTTKDDTKLGDSDRWGTLIGQHTVLVFPKDSPTPITVPGAQVVIPGAPNMHSNLAIATNRGRYYTFDLRIRKPFTPSVSFYYPDDVRAQAAAFKQQEAQAR